MDIIPLPAFRDNYIWLMHDGHHALVVDPDEGCDTGTPAAWAATNARMALADPESSDAFLEALGREARDRLG